MTYKIHRFSTPTYLSRYIKLRQSARSLRSSDVPLIDKPTIRTEFVNHIKGKITAELGRALGVLKVTLQVNGNSQFWGVWHE